MLHGGIGENDCFDFLVQLVGLLLEFGSVRGAGVGDVCNWVQFTVPLDSDELLADAPSLADETGASIFSVDWRKL